MQFMIKINIMNFESAYDYLNNLNSSDKYLNDYYEEITSFENAHIIPFVKIETAVFLNCISKFIQPKKVLEIGFGSGVSSLFIHRDLKDFKIFISLERDNNRFLRGKNILQKYKIENIDLIKVDAFEFLKTNNEQFDFIFLDAVKRDYIEYLSILKSILNKNGILICDNILFNGKVIEKNIEEKYMDGVSLLKQFNEKRRSRLHHDY